MPETAKGDVLKKAVLKNISVESLFNKVVPTQVFPCKYCEILKTKLTLILKNICKRLLLNVVSNSNKEQHLLAKLNEMG